jgi:hypothetical protein
MYEMALRLWRTEEDAVMRRYVIAAALVLGLVVLWAALLPLAAQPLPVAPTRTPSSSSPVMPKALVLG